MKGESMLMPSYQLESFADGLHKPFMVISGIVYLWALPHYFDGNFLFLDGNGNFYNFRILAG